MDFLRFDHQQKANFFSLQIATVSNSNSINIMLLSFNPKPYWSFLLSYSVHDYYLHFTMEYVLNYQAEDNNWISRIINKLLRNVILKLLPYS